jgi:hypothetical protein
MTDSQRAIINLIHDGYKTKHIMAVTGKTKGYINNIRKAIRIDPHHFEPIMRRVYVKPPEPVRKPKIDRSGRAECLKCEQMFDSYDTRLNRICPRCSTGRDEQEPRQLMNRPFHHMGAI